MIDVSELIVFDGHGFGETVSGSKISGEPQKSQGGGKNGWNFGLEHVLTQMIFSALILDLFDIATRQTAVYLGELANIFWHSHTLDQ